MRIKPEKMREILRAWENYQERTEMMYEEMIWDLSNKLNLTERTIRRMLDHGV